MSSGDPLHQCMLFCAGLTPAEGHMEPLGLYKVWATLLLEVGNK